MRKEPGWAPDPAGRQTRLGARPGWAPDPAGRQTRLGGWASDLPGCESDLDAVRYGLDDFLDGLGHRDAVSL